MESKRRVEPVDPVAPYIGGKKNLARRIVERIERTPHDGYAEPFVGMGGVFLRRDDSGLLLRHARGTVNGIYIRTQKYPKNWTRRATPAQAAAVEIIEGCAVARIPDAILKVD